jgi:branched-chain amino acid transport system substrate-binding protein
MKKSIIWAVIIVVVVGLGFLVSRNSNKPVIGDESIKIGAILPLTGSAAVWGEAIRNGMGMALKDRQNIEVIYEDSKALPADGASAYQRLMTQNVDAVISAYSGVSIPLTKLAAQNKIPLIMTIVAADGVTNEYSYRYYAKPSSYVEPAFTDPASPLGNLTDIAVLYRNDEFGKSVSDILGSTANQKGQEIIIKESFNPNDTDFSTQLTKIKAAKPQVVMFIAGSPGEAVNILKKANDLKINAVFMEASAALSDPETQKQAPATTYYTTAFRFSFPDDNPEFKKLYTDTYGKAPNFASAFGYDIATLIADCPISSMKIKACLDRNINIDGITGNISGIVNNEINPPMFLMKIN